MKKANIKNYNAKYFLSKRKNVKLTYEILNDYNNKEERYWYICQSDGLPLYDDDGNNIHFSSYEEAAAYLNQLTE